MQEVFAIGDIHGRFDLFEKMLQNVDFQTQQLLLIGDLADRGLDGKKCFYLGKKLVEEHGAIYLKGNHEKIFLEFIKKPEEVGILYQANGGAETLESFFFKGVLEEYSFTEISMMLQTQHKDLLQFLEKLPTAYEWEHYLFVHAGVDLRYKNWQDSTEEDFLWIRAPFHQGKNNTGKTIVFGHTVTMNLHQKANEFSIWEQDQKIGIDGGAVYGGLLHGVVFGREGIVKKYELSGGEADETDTSNVHGGAVY